MSSHHLPSMGALRSPLQKPLWVFVWLGLNFSFFMIFFSQRMNGITLYFSPLPRWFIPLHSLDFHPSALPFCAVFAARVSPPLSSVSSHCLAGFYFHPLLMPLLFSAPSPVPSTPVQDSRALPCTSLPPTHPEFSLLSTSAPPRPPSLLWLVAPPCIPASPLASPA